MEIKNVFTQTLNAAANSLNCFRQVDEFNISTENNTDHIVRIYALNNNKDIFEYDALVRLLQNNVANYVFNRKKVLGYKERDEQVLSSSEAIAKFKEISETALKDGDYGSGGELGEMLLYVFLEAYQKAFKIMSKMEIKTNSNTYAHGFDGVHFLVKKYDKYIANQLIYGEAKIEDELSKSIREAFKSLKTSYDNRTNDISLLDDAILNEVAIDEESTEYLKSIIIPKYRQANSNYENEDAFAIFAGYTFSGVELNANSDAPKIEIDKKIKQDTKNLKRNLIKKINNLMLPKSSDFYIFVLPFNDAPKDKHEIMKKVLGGK